MIKEIKPEWHPVFEMSCQLKDDKVSGDYHHPSCRQQIRQSGDPNHKKAGSYVINKSINHGTSQIIS